MTNPERLKPLLLGIPYEGPSLFLRGMGLAPAKIRWALESIESWSPYQKKPMPPYEDLGDLVLPPGLKTEEILIHLRKVLEGRLTVPHPRILVLGGDHTVSLPVIQTLFPLYPDLTVLHFDAHLDRRDTYEGHRFNHATVMKRLEEILGEDRVLTFGYRSRAEEEKERGYPYEVLKPLREVLPRLGTRSLYLSLDLDVLDPSEFPAVSNPEPGGIRFKELLEALLLLQGRLVAADLVEYNPLVSGELYPAVTAALLMREILILLGG